MVQSWLLRQCADASLDANESPYTEFRVFVEHAERELWQLFESIDRDHNGELDRSELKAAFSRAGLAISNAKLDQFFDEVDVNHDGVISFDEWRLVRLFSEKLSNELATDFLPTETFCSLSPLRPPISEPYSRTIRLQLQSIRKVTCT